MSNNKLIRNSKIKKKAKELYPENKECYNAFLQGSEYADNNPVDVWKSIRQIPKADNRIKVLITVSGEAMVTKDKITKNWNYIVARFSVYCWTYLDYLIPKDILSKK